MKCFRQASLLMLFYSLGSHCWAQAHVPCENLFTSYDQDWAPAGSTYVPVDSWVYPAIDRLHALGEVDTIYLGMRPWTRLSIVHALEAAADTIGERDDGSESCRIYQAVQRELKPDVDRLDNPGRGHAEIATIYSRFLGISGVPLRDSFHLGQSIINDYGRPYQQGSNNVTGFSTRMESGRFAFYLRGEYQYAPGAIGYSPGLTSLLSNIDQVPLATNPVQDTIPAGPIASVSGLRVVEANASYLILNHEISFGKSDHWLGPAQGGSFAWSNNAENLYSFQIDRVEPLHIPLLSRYTGPFRYQFFVGSLKGHTDPNAPWVHVEKLSFKPTTNLEFGFERTVIWGGKGHVPITIGSFLRSFFSTTAGTAAQKFSRNDPGARFGTFDFTYRLPYMRRWLTLYTDSLVHDDVSPISAPPRAGLRPGLYLSQFPKYHQIDFRVEAADTDPPTTRSNGGEFLYWEQVQRQGYTNKGFIMGDWIGRESKGGQAWLTYHLSPGEQIQLSYRGAKAAKDFIPGGTTQNSFQISAIKRVGKQVELQGFVQYERWKAPVYKLGSQNDTGTAFQITWRPEN
jgi:hypothetical protein